MAKLTNTTKSTAATKHTLTNKTSVPFRISLERSLENNYCFKKLKSSELRAFNTFIDKTVGRNLTFKEVDSVYLRSPDTSDEIEGKQVHHYQVSQSFRIHGYLQGGYFVLCRIDPSHKFHK